MDAVCSHLFTALPLRTNLHTTLIRGLRFAAFCFVATMMVGCLGGLNVMGHDVPDSEYHAMYDRQIDREKQRLEPDEHDERGRVPSCDQYWCTVGGTAAVPPTNQSRRLKRYIIEKRRAAGLPELTCGLDFDQGGPRLTDPSGTFRRDRYYKPGDPRIFQ